jgi:hypothetical protein
MYNLHKILGWSYKCTKRWACGTHGKTENCTNLQNEDLKQKDNFEESGVDCRIIFKWMLQKLGGRM